MTSDEHLADRIEAATRYLEESVRTFTRACDLDLLTGEAACNVLLASASLIAKAHFGESAGAAFLERRVTSLANEMRGKALPLN